MENPTPEAAPVKKKKFKKLIVLLLALVLIGGAAGGGFYYWRSTKASAAESKNDSAKSKKKNSKKESVKVAEEDEETAPDEKETSAKKEASKPETDFLKGSLPDDENVKHIVELQPFIVNLADSEQARYLRMTVSLGIGGESPAEEKPDQVFNSRVRNAILAVLSIKKSEDVLSPDGKAKLRKEILQAAQAVSSESEIEAIYITEFIVQL
ncbi:MAG: flagellar basal body-associated FliL family protein [Pyrinomonadaceae bacterium]|nr:flagellar basal body-associated FliL family protein [Pyrinomonadaceae bacterium]